MASPSSGAGARSLLVLAVSAVAGVLVAGLALPAIGLVGSDRQARSRELPVPARRAERAAAQAALPSAGRRRHGLATFYGQNRIDVPLDKISQVMQDAIVAIEDARFYEHDGVDLRGTLRALVANTQAGEVTQGGSTITQQYVKNVLAATADTREETAGGHRGHRHPQAARAALRPRPREALDQAAHPRGLPQHRLLRRAAYGIEAAAQRYFSDSGRRAQRRPGRDAWPASSSTRRSTTHSSTRQESEDRRNFVLQRMADENMISQAQADKFAKQPMKKTLNPSDLTRGCLVSPAPFFCDYVERVFLSDPAYGATRGDRRRLLYGGGLTIRTTLEMDDQAAAQAGIEAKLPTGDPSGRVAAIAMIEPGTGNVTAMTQNLEYGPGKNASYINNSVDLKYSGTNGNQPGSTFKIFTIAAAIEQGQPMDDVIASPSVREMPYGSYEDCEGNTQATWPVENYSSATPGNYTMYSGTADSINTYFAELARRTGLCNIWDVASRAGVTAAGIGNGYEAGDAPIDSTACS